MHRAITGLLVAVGLLVPTASAGAEPVKRLANLEGSVASPYDFDQVSRRCPTSIATRDTALAYSGSASLKVHTEDDPSCEGAFVRGIFQVNSTRHLVEGDDLWFGAAIYLPAGFYSAHTGYTDLLRADSYVNDDSTSTPFADRAEINFASWSNDNLYVRAARDDTPVTLIGPISPAALPEGSWNWVEIHVHLSATDGSAYTQLKVNGEPIGSSTTANLFAGATPLNRLRYGIVSTGWSGSGDLTAYFDRASISPTERGPIPLADAEPVVPAPPTEPGSVPSMVSLWRLDEPGALAIDTMGAAPGTYVNGPTLGVPGLVNSPDLAASFDGVDDYVAIPPTGPLDLKDGITLEAWIKADTFQGSVIRRNNSYEMRPQDNESVLCRIWIDGSVQSLTSPSGTVPPGAPHHLVCTYDGMSIRIYVDGSQVASRAQTGTMTGDRDTLYIGRNTYANTYFAGVIDDVAIYSEALSAAVVLERYEAAQILD